jgi:hypothetical protein
VIRVAELHEAVTIIVDPQSPGRQYLATFIATLSGTRAGGFVMTRQEAAGSWIGATYALTKTDQTPIPREQSAIAAVRPTAWSYVLMISMRLLL